MAYSISAQNFVALSDLHPNLARPVGLSNIVLLFSNEIVYNGIELLQNYAIDVYLYTWSINIIIRHKEPYLLCVHTRKMKIDAAAVQRVWVPQL